MFPFLFGLSCSDLHIIVSPKLTPDDFQNIYLSLKFIFIVIENKGFLYTPI